MNPHPVARRTLPAILDYHARTRGSHALALDDLGILTYAEAEAAAARVSSLLARLGVGKGGRVGIMLPNRREFLLAWFGAALIGAVEVPINAGNSRERLVHILNHSQCRVLVAEADDLERLGQLSADLRYLEQIVVVDGSARRAPGFPFRIHDWAAGLAAEPPRGIMPARVGPWDPVAIMYTSGSTGPAKGAVLSHGHHYMNGFQAVASTGITADDVIYVSTPLHHNMAQGYGVWPALLAGATVRIAPRFNRDSFWTDVQSAGATVLPFVGAMLVLLAKLPESPSDADNSIRVGYGVPIPAGLRRPFERRFGLRLIRCYGSTEATIVAWNTDDQDDSDAVGRVFPGYEVRIFDDNDLEVLVGETGEICVRTDQPHSMFSGYLDDPAKTAEATRNLWFHTGDRGRFDERGRLWFSGRFGDVIRCKGENISAFEIEQIVTGHPGVSLAAAYGVPSELTDEDIVVVVTRRAGHSLDPAELFAWSAERMPRYMRPRYIDVVDDLPLTPTGKIEKYKLRQHGLSSTAVDGRGLGRSAS
jgi:carnitine-CoA ligase